MGYDTVSGLAKVAELAATEHWLAVLTTIRADGDPAPAVVNVGIIDHPSTGERVLALVSRGGTAKLRNLRRAPRANLVFRAGWDWIAVSGPTEIFGPDDPHPDIAGDQLPGLLRTIFTAAGGKHDDFDAYDREMVATRRAAVFVRPARFIANAPQAD
ncbi:pyridoxamine 5'-phosphate oxidase family protein [Actinokineospora inagensis]|uniref:pyridoxamine 5'-phosphate oxidase family protein n=1 Tax=Actinokineospora inagensis TaxID=103730 RepID=UPI0004290BD2|nr:pyridoxamine 5'-phosphate oxidase family protein [Actinokineospora inagensis]